MIYDILNELLGREKNKNIGTNLKYNCPNCTSNNFGVPDNKYNLEITLNNENPRIPYKKLYHCWSCGISGELFKLVRKYGDSDLIKRYKEKENDILVIKNRKKYLRLPKEFISFKNIDKNNPQHLEAYNYLTIDRCLDEKTILKDNIGFCLEGFYKKRIIIPTYDINGRLNFFFTRNYDKNSNEKYLNSNVPRNEIIYNEHNINWNSTIYLVEGYFEAKSLPLNTIILNGKALSPLLSDKILTYKPNVVICLNKDAIKKTNQNSINSTIAIKEFLEKYNINVKYLDYPNNDDLNKTLKTSGKNGIIVLLKEFLQ